MTANPLSTIPPIGPATGMTPPPPASKFKPIDPIKLIRKHWKLLIVCGIIGLIIGVGLYVVLRKTAPAYTSDAKLVVDTRTVDNPYAVATDVISGRLDAAYAFMNNEAAFIISDEIVTDALVRPRARATAWFQAQPNAEDARELMQEEMLRVTAIKNTTLISLTMTAPNAEDSRVLLEEVLETYLNKKKLNSSTATSSLQQLFFSDRNQSEDLVRQISKRIDNFITDHDITSLNVAQSQEQVIYNQLLEQQMRLTLGMDSVESNYQSLLGSTNSTVMSDEENAYIKQLPTVSSREEELRRLDESRRQLLAQGIREQHSQIKNLDRRRDTVEFELGKLKEKELGEMRALQIQSALKQREGLAKQLETIVPQIAETEVKLGELTQRITEFGRLNSELQFARERQERAQTAVATLQTIAQRTDSVKVKRHTDPSEPQLTSPKLVVWVGVLPMLLTGLIAGIVLLREMLDQRVRSPQDLKLLPDANLLGQVPHANEDPTGGSIAERTVERAPTGLLAESFRQIRTSVLSKMDRRGYKTLVCVSAQPEAGTSTVVQNLATSLAFNGRNVLIIDANFRRPSQHVLMDCGNSRGLIDVLKDQAEAEDVIVAHPDTSLSLMPTGHAADSPPELLEGATFRGLLGLLETQYDIILIDAPPALLTSDSQLLSKHVDAIAVVVQAGSDKRGMLGRMLRQLDGQRADVLGVILNGVKSSVGGYFRKSYEDFYRYRQSAAREQRNVAAAPPAKPPKPSKKDKKAAKAAKKNGGGDRIANEETAGVASPLDDLDLDMDIDLPADDDLKL